MAREPSLAELTEFAVDLAWNAGRITLRYFQTRLEIVTKDDGTPVTVADRSAEAALRRAIRARYPDDGIVGEEHGEAAGSTGRTWIVDPIDGTLSFIRGVPLYGLLIGLEIGGAAAAGVIHLPAMGEMVAAWRGGGCFLNGRRVRVSRTSDLSRALLTTSDLTDVPGRLAAAAGLRRTWGDCYGYSLVASGRAEVMIDRVAKVWDLAAVQPIVEEAGGRLTDLDGNRTIRGGHAVATNGLVHNEVLEHLRDR